MIPFIYSILLTFMLFVLYNAGMHIKTHNKILAPISIFAIIIYTLNEGLRFGRGIDYNLYGMSYEYLEKGVDNTWDIVFKAVAKTLIELGISWQGYVLLMSFIFIFSTFCLLKNYKDVLPIALPLFVLFSIPETENMVRWYLGFSFIMIGLSFLLGNRKRKKLIFFLYSTFACTIHLALAPLPIIFFIITLLKSPILKPLPALILFFSISILFQTEFMLRFIQLVNMLSMVSERFEGYGNRAEYWLTGGFAGTENSALPNIHELVFLCCIVVLGYNVIQKNGEWKNIYAYNLFIIGLLFNPIARQIELTARYDQPFFFFRAIVLACILEYIYKQKLIVIKKPFFYISLLVFSSMGMRLLTNPFRNNEEYYLYVWDRKGKNYESMYYMHISNMYSVEKKRKRLK